MLADGTYLKEEEKPDDKADKTDATETTEASEEMGE